MRDRYLFRGKRTDSGEWVYGLLGRYNADFECANIIDEFELLVPVKTESVGQYTGLTDKNGKKIFEGDIVNDEQSGYNYFIKWFPEYACFSLANKNGNMEFGCDEFEIFLNDLIVAGNIYDNPECLKGE